MYLTGDKLNLIYPVRDNRSVLLQCIWLGTKGLATFHDRFHMQGVTRCCFSYRETVLDSTTQKRQMPSQSLNELLMTKLEHDFSKFIF